MAPASSEAASLHLAPLDACLTRGHRLISWRKAFETFYECNKSNTPAPDALVSFFSDDRSTHQLGNCYEPFKPRTRDTKDDFETRTAQVNVTPTENGLYDIQKIKDDVLWLAGQANIDETSALRISILEWQTRSTARMISGYAEEERISLQKALSRETPLPHQDSAAAFDVQHLRRARLVEILLEERLYIIKCFATITSLSWLEAPQPPAERTYPASKGKDIPLFGWLGDVESKLQAVGRRSNSAPDLASDLVIRSVDSLQRRLTNMENVPNWSTGDDDKDAALAVLSQDHQLLELTSILQVIFVSTCASAEPFNAATVQAWYISMQSLDFFSAFTPPQPRQQEYVAGIQLLVSLISLTILKLPYSLDKIMDDQDPAGDGKYYFQDDNCLQLLAGTLSEVGYRRVKIASPAMFALAMLLRTFKYQLAELRGDGEDDELPDSPLASRATPGASSAQRTLEKALQHIHTDEMDIDPIQFLAHMAIDQCEIFAVMVSLGDTLATYLDALVDLTPQLHARIALLELLRYGVSVTSYNEQTIETSLALLGRKIPQIDSTDRGSTDLYLFVAEAFLADLEVFAPILFDQARARFPYEQSPYLLLIECLGQVKPSARVWDDVIPFQQIIGVSKKFTQILPQNFTGYELVREDENANAIRLTEDLPLFANRRLNGLQRQIATNGHGSFDNDSHQLSAIPAGTLGFVISENRPFVVVWEFEHSLWSYFGTILSTIPLGSIRQELVSSGDARLIASEIFNIMTAHLDSAAPGQSDADFKEAAELIIEEASDCLDRGQDIVALTFEIFEEELSRHTEQRGEESTDLLVSCTRFIKAIMALVPHRVWPALARSQLLDTDGHSGKLMAVAGSTEIVIGKYDFLISTAYLFRALVEDTLVHCVSYEAQSTALTKRSDRFNSTSSRPPVKVMSSVLVALARTYLDILQSSSEWTFIDQTQQLQLTTIITEVFDTILTSVFGYDDSQEPAKKVTRALYPAAKHISQMFLSAHGSHLAVNSLVLRFFAGTNAFQNQSLSFLQKTTAMLMKILALSQTLIHVSSSGAEASTYLDLQLFRSLSLIVRLYSLDHSLRTPIITLLTVLVKKAGLSDQEPPSIFGHLGPDVSKNFLRMLGDLDRPFEDLTLRAEIWSFLATVVSSKQQWFATHMLTGSDPRERLKGKRDNLAGRAPTFLETALDDFSAMDEVGTQWALGLLRFVSQAQNHWPWVTGHIGKHPNFLSKLGQSAGIAQIEKTTISMAEQFELTKQHSSVAIVAEIMAMCLYNLRKMGDVSSIIKHLVPRLSFLKEKGFFQPRYAEGLHQKLRSNFESVYPGCTPQCFKRQFGASELGSNYYYDLQFARNLLSFHPSWERKSGFKEEFVRANINLSLVESQIQAMSSWRTLAVELSKSMEQDESLRKPLGYLVIECLEMCNSADLSHKIFAQVVSSCADLALTVLQRLITIKPSAEVMRSILRPSWTLVQRAGEANIFVGETAAYYRTSLKILLLAIQPHTWPAPPSSAHTLEGKDGKISETSMILLDVVTEVVAKGFRTLASELHETPEHVYPSDFAIITAILQATMQVQGIEFLHSLIALRLSDSGSARYAIALFSWSDRLTAASLPISRNNALSSYSNDWEEEEADPIFGDLSLSFLLELSNLQPMAEFLASENILAQLNTAPLMKYFRRPGGSGPFDTPSPRLFTIWSRGILPLCLNLLLTVGESIAMEVAMFLNNYPEQLQRASGGFDDKPQPTPRNPTAGSISLNMAAEAQTLGLLNVVLDRCRASPGAAVMGEIPQVAGWDRAMVKEDLEIWVNGGKAALRERLLPTSEKEVGWLRQPASTKSAGVESRLEEMILGEMEAALKCLSMG